MHFAHRSQGQQGNCRRTRGDGSAANVLALDVQGSTSRRLRFEGLETRALLAADVFSANTAAADPSPPVNVATSADITGDGIVDVLDANQVAVHWLTDNAAADVNDDGVVDIFDLAAVSNQWTVAAVAAAQTGEGAELTSESSPDPSMGDGAQTALRTLPGGLPPDDPFSARSTRVDTALDARLLDLAIADLQDDAVERRDAASAIEIVLTIEDASSAALLRATDAAAQQSEPQTQHSHGARTVLCTALAALDA